MAWRGRQQALQLTTPEAFKSYLQSLNFSNWRPSGIVQHNTASPTLQQWWHGGTKPAQRMKNLRAYYEGLGWSAGPHAFVDGVSVWVMTDFNVKGVHSPSWNGTRLGIEMVGDYSTEDDETGPGKKVLEQTTMLFAVCCEFFGWDVDNTRIKQHKEDPATTHDCPGRKVVKSEFLADINSYISEGGEHGQEPEEPRSAVVANVGAGDRLNVRSAASSSAPVIGQADNGDAVVVVGSSMNGTTRWMRLQFGQGEGSGVEVFGWVVDKYLVVDGETPAVEVWRRDITATVFGSADDQQDSAYPDIDWITPTTRGIALPFKWKGERPQVTVKGPAGEVTTEIVDLGPWNYDDSAYVHNGARPLVEKQYQQRTQAQNGRVPTNDAGIDLTPPIARAVGISGKGKVSWRFAPQPKEEGVEV